MESIRLKQQMIIPEIDFEDVSVNEAIDYLRRQTREHDNLEIDPSQKGVNFVLRDPATESGLLDDELDAAGAVVVPEAGKARIKNLKLKNVPLDTALDYIADQAGLEVKVDEYAVKLEPKRMGPSDDIVTRRWSVGADFMRKLDHASVESEGEADPVFS